MNKADLVKLALAKKNGGSAQNAKPLHLTMQGSIFSAPTLQKPQNVISQNVNKSITDLSQNKGLVKNDSKSTTSPAPTSVSSGKAAANEGDALNDKLQNINTQTNKNNQLVTKFDKDSQKLQKQLKKDDSTFKKQMQKEQKIFTLSQKQITAAAGEIEKNDAELLTLHSELETLTAGDNTGVGSTSAFSLKLGSAVQEEPSSNPNADRIKDLQTRINSKNTLSQTYGNQIVTLQKTSSRSMAKMDKMSKQHIKTQTLTSKNIQNNQEQTSGVIKAAEKADQIAQLVQMTGQTLDMAGKGLVALGSVMVTGGQALIAAGSIMQKVGKVSMMVGQYGSCAANLTKTAAFAAEGNLKGALMSAASAIQSGAAAAKSTKNLKGDLKAINAEAQNATAKVDALKEAKAEVKANGAIDGMSKKQSTKAMQAEILEGKSAAEARTNVTADFQAEQAKVDSTMTEALEAKGKTIKNADKFQKKVNKQAAKNVASGAKENVSNYGQAATKTASKTKGGFMDKLNKFAGGLTALASQLPDSTPTSNQGSGFVYRHKLSPQAQRIIQQNQNRRAALRARGF